MAESIEWNIASALHRRAAEQPDHIALITGKNGRYQQSTFLEIAANANKYANGLQDQGVDRGDRVMLMVRPSMEFICLTYALFQLGAVVILIDPGMGYKNLLRCIGSVQPEVLIGIPQVLLLSRLYSAPFKTVTTRICVGASFGVLGTSLQQVTRNGSTDCTPVQSDKDELAAIIFTTGSTGPPKGVQYSHSIFYSQLRLIADYYGITPGDVDQPGFPLFALFSIALGASAVIPDMDPTRPAQVDPKKFIRSIMDHKVSYSFGSPAIWNVVSEYCIQEGITLPVRKVLMAGAPITGDLIERVKSIMEKDGEVFVPYGATESLPIVSITGKEVLGETWPLTRKGFGVCVGNALPDIRVEVIESRDAPIKSWHDVQLLDEYEVGEIVVKGGVVTRKYDHNPEETTMSKIPEGEELWHRMGDMGYFDVQGRLWFCGRKAHRVLLGNDTMYSVCCEAIFNNHPDVFRSALVGIGKPGEQKPVLIVELHESKEPVDRERLLRELQQRAERTTITNNITKFLIHPSFPVDIRHNAKIFREKLAVWAAKQLGS